MKKTIISLSILLAFGFSGCSTSSALATYDVTKIDFSKSGQWKKGESCQELLFGFIPTPLDGTIKDAAKDGQISKILYVETKSFFPYCTIVYGE